MLQNTLKRYARELKDLSPDGLGISSSFWDLNERQKVILGILDQPGVSITNKTVQKRFKISQITASRDLSKLAILGLLLVTVREDQFITPKFKLLKIVANVQV